MCCMAALFRGSHAGNPARCPVPSASLLVVHAAGTPALVGLLQAVIRSQSFSKSAASSAAAVITALPWSSDITADAVLPILVDAVNNQVFSVAPILQLPAAKELPPGDVLGLLPAAVQSNLSAVVRQLGRWVVAWTWSLEAPCNWR